MQDSFPIPSCFSSGEKFSSGPSKSAQGAVNLAYRTKISGRCRLITVAWCRNLLAHGLSVSVEGPSDVRNNENSNDITTSGCRIDLRPWCFWRRLGSKRFQVDGEPVEVFWDLRSATFSSGEPEPRSDYYVALVSGDEVVLLLGDRKKEAYRRTGSRPAFIDATFVAKKEHVFGKTRFATTAKFHEKGRRHDIAVECVGGNDCSGGNADPEMVIKIDGHAAVHVRHLQWKFRGNQSISIGKGRVELYWDAHDWLFSPGMRHALFIFKPLPSPGSSSSSSSSSLSSLFSSIDGNASSTTGGSSSGFCLFLYAWKLE